jgi:peptidoglycan-N-acetylglucosamine deacetylase
MRAASVALGRVAGLAGIVALAGHAGPAATWLPWLRRAFFPALAGIGHPGHVALTFDDGPDPVSTPLFLDVLDVLGVHGTFFVLGSSARRHARLTREIRDRGHEVAVHGWTHDRPWLPAVRHELRDLGRAVDAVGDLTGAAPRWYRPPYGILTGGRQIAAARTGLRPVLWSAWGRDWSARETPASVRATIVRDLDGGGTVLLHDTDRSACGRWQAALGALPVLVADCRAGGWTVGPLREHWS